METTLPRLATGRLARPRLDPAGAGTWGLAFALVLASALAGGGYGDLERDQLGMAVWWVLLVGAATGAIGTLGRRRGFAAVALLAGLASWTALSAGWSASAEATSRELTRDMLYLGVLMLGLAAAARTSPRHLLAGVACGAGAVAALAVLSRLHPAWFPSNPLPGFLIGSSQKLAYPVNYWNGLAAIAAIGAPLLLAQASAARTLAGQALAAAALPLCALTVYYTVSRDGVLALAVGLGAFVVLAPDRRPKVATLALAGTASALAIAAAAQRGALRNGADSALAHRQGNSMLALVLVVCAGVALAQIAISLWARHCERPRPKRLRMALSTLAVLALAGAWLGGTPHAVTQAWRDFQRPGFLAPVPDVIAKLQTTGGNGRYQLWQAAAGAWHSHPWRGIGAGSYQYWWAQHGSLPLFVRDAHSLYMQSLAELGLVGVALLAGLLALGLGAGVRSALRSISESRRVVAAAATAGLLAFGVDAAFEWLWQLPAVTVIATLLLAAALGGRSPRGSRAERGGLGVVSLAAIIVLALPLAAATALQDSRAAAGRGDLAAALRHARTAARLAAADASPRLQVALVEERGGALSAAAQDARRAAQLAPQDPQPLIALARIEAESRHGRPAVAAYARARSLSPRSPLFAQLEAP